MGEKQEARKVRRKFTPEQKFEILKDIERGRTEGLEKHRLSDLLCRKWKRQLEVGVRASLRNGRPLKPGELGDAAAAVAKLMHPHFIKKEEYAPLAKTPAYRRRSLQEYHGE